MPLALLEHINLNVTSRDAAYAFYVTALGGRVNEPTTNERQLHVNLGASQFHLLLQEVSAAGPAPEEGGCGTEGAAALELGEAEGEDAFEGGTAPGLLDFIFSPITPFSIE